jgi:hypothetical protein
MRLPGVPGFEVCVRCDGANLREYDGEDNRDHREFTAVKYVEATSGANFIVSFRADPSQMNRILDSHVSLKVSLDGKCINGKV